MRISTKKVMAGISEEIEEKYRFPLGDGWSPGSEKQTTEHKLHFPQRSALKPGCMVDKEKVV